MIEKSCEQCGTTFQGKEKQRTCSCLCGQRLRSRETGTFTDCHWCGKKFRMRMGGRRIWKFCSRKCYFSVKRLKAAIRAAQEKFRKSFKRIAVCIECDKQFAAGNCVPMNVSGIAKTGRAAITSAYSTSQSTQERVPTVVLNCNQHG